MTTSSTSRPPGTTNSGAPSSPWQQSIAELRSCCVSLAHLCEQVISSSSAGSSSPSPGESSPLHASVLTLLAKREAA